MKYARSAATIIAAVVALAVATLPTIAETSCKSSWFGYCISRYTSAEQAKIDAQLLFNLQMRLRHQVRYYNGTLMIEDETLDTINTFPATIAWSISCDNTGVAVNIGDVSETGSGVAVNLTDQAVDAAVCRSISGPLGAAVLQLTRGE
jgi:hypothetical protein